MPLLRPVDLARYSFDGLILNQSSRPNSSVRDVLETWRHGRLGSLRARHAVPLLRPVDLARYSFDGLILNQSSRPNSSVGARRAVPTPSWTRAIWQRLDLTVDLTADARSDWRGHARSGTLRARHAVPLLRPIDRDGVALLPNSGWSAFHCLEVKDVPEPVSEYNLVREFFEKASTGQAAPVVLVRK